MRDLVQSASAASNPCLQTPGGSGASTPVAVSANTTPRQSASGIEARIGPDAASSAAMPAVPHVSAGHTAGSAEAGNPSSPGLAALARVQQLIERLLWDEEDSVTGAPDDLLPPPPSALGAAGSGEEAGLPQSDQCDPPESSAGERDPKKSDPVPALQLLAETVGTSVDGQLAFVVAGGMPAVMAFFPSYPEQVSGVLWPVNSQHSGRTTGREGDCPWGRGVHLSDNPAATSTAMPAPAPLSQCCILVGFCVLMWAVHAP
jgi:hypothetical protein